MQHCQLLDAIGSAPPRGVGDTSAKTIDCIKPDADGGLPYAFSAAMQSDGSQVAILFAHSVTVQQGAGVSVKGALPLVLVASTMVNIQGTLQSATPGNAGGALVTQSGAGGGLGGGAGGNHAGAGGGGYCGTGGQGVRLHPSGPGEADRLALCPT